MIQSNKINPWSLYWSQDKLHSCVAQSSDQDQIALNTYWQNFSKNLEPNSRLLDLATGNGAVVHALLSANKTIHIDALDKASINPERILTEHSDLKNIHFHSDTDILDTSFEAETFDAITSQFGIEYAGIVKASLQVIPYLKVAGRIQFIVHHCDSGVITSSKNKIIELEKLTEKSGILDTLISVLSGKVEFEKLETIGQAYLQQDLVRTEQISGQVFTGIERIISGLQDNPKESIELGVAMDLRVRAELARLHQLTQAGQSEEQMTEWQNAISKQGMDAEFSPLFLDPTKQEYLLGWSATGVRNR